VAKRERSPKTPFATPPPVKVESLPEVPEDYFVPSQVLENLTTPESLAVSSRKELFVTNKCFNRIDVVDTETCLTKRFIDLEEATVVGVAIGKQDTVHILYAGANVVDVFEATKNGEYITPRKTIQLSPTVGPDMVPTAIAVSDKGLVAVTLINSARKTSAIFLGGLGREPKLLPFENEDALFMGIAFSHSDLYVSEECMGRICVINQQGVERRFISTRKVGEETANKMRPRQLCVRDKKIIVSFANYKKLRIFSRGGRLLREFGDERSHGVAVDNNNVVYASFSAKSEIEFYDEILRGLDNPQGEEKIKGEPRAEFFL